MNFLAHIYLSGDNDLIKIGNFMADSIRGKSYLEYNGDLQKGILLHRQIDSFTDAHPIVKQSTKKLHSKFHHYSGVIVDVFYDHFLAKNWHLYSEVPLRKFTLNFYQLLDNNQPILTDKILHMLPYLKKGDWLYNYQFIDELQRILTQMDNRTGNKSNMKEAHLSLTEHYNEFEKEFTTFFKELQNHCALFLSNN